MNKGTILGVTLIGIVGISGCVVYAGGRHTSPPPLSSGGGDLPPSRRLHRAGPFSRRLLRPLRVARQLVYHRRPRPRGQLRPLLLALPGRLEPRAPFLGLQHLRRGLPTPRPRQQLRPPLLGVQEHLERERPFVQLLGLFPPCSPSRMRPFLLDLHQQVGERCPPRELLPLCPGPCPRLPLRPLLLGLQGTVAGRRPHPVLFHLLPPRPQDRMRSPLLELQQDLGRGRPPRELRDLRPGSPSP